MPQTTIRNTLLPAHLIGGLSGVQKTANLYTQTRLAINSRISSSQNKTPILPTSFNFPNYATEYVLHGPGLHLILHCSNLNTSHKLLNKATKLTTLYSWK
jgi:hypothetical protein